jgi:DNA-directed RNA polymerase
LTDDPVRYDPYGRVAKAVTGLLDAASDGKIARWWRDVLCDWNDKQRRKLIKTAVLAYPYGVTEGGMQKDLAVGFKEICKGEVREDRPKGAYVWLAEKVDEAIRTVLPGAARSREYIRGLADHVVDQGKFVVWRSPSGFPIINANFLSQVERLRYTSGQTQRVAIRDSEERDEKVARRSVAANFVHSLDASHLVRCVLSANYAGITNILTIHDCLGILAPDVADMTRIFYRELYVMYKSANWLDYLRLNNGYHTPPVMGVYDLEQLATIKPNYGIT